MMCICRLQGGFRVKYCLTKMATRKLHFNSRSSLGLPGMLREHWPIGKEGDSGEVWLDTPYGSAIFESVAEVGRRCRCRSVVRESGLLIVSGCQLWWRGNHFCTFSSRGGEADNFRFGKFNFVPCDRQRALGVVGDMEFMTAFLSV